METSRILAKMHLSAHKAIFFAKGPKHLDLSFPAATRWHGKAQDWVCEAETTAFYRLGTRMTEWLTHLH